MWSRGNGGVKADLMLVKNARERADNANENVEIIPHVVSRRNEHSLSVNNAYAEATAEDEQADGEHSERSSREMQASVVRNSSEQTRCWATGVCRVYVLLIRWLHLDEAIAVAPTSLARWRQLKQ